MVVLLSLNLPKKKAFTIAFLSCHFVQRTRTSFNIGVILGSSNKPSTYTHNNAKKKYGPTRAIISPTLGFHFSPYGMTKREKRGDGKRVGVEDDKGPMVGQHLEGARIKLLRADLVGGSVCAGAAS